MNAYLAEPGKHASLDHYPVLIAGDSGAAISRATTTVAASGLRVADGLPLAALAERLRRQVGVSAVWIELDGNGGTELDEIAGGLVPSLEAGTVAGIVATSLSQLDDVFARVGDARFELLVDSSDTERAAALALAVSGAARPASVSDVASDKNAARLRQLSEEVNRIASTLARLSADPETAGVKTLPSVQGGAEDLPPVSADTVRSIIRARRLRSRYFPDELFADPAWDMLLDLLQAEIAQLRVPVSSLCIAAAVPATTALRWLKTMTEQGIFVRRADPHDGRRVFVELAPESSRALRRYFAEVGQAAVI